MSESFIEQNTDKTDENYSAVNVSRENHEFDLQFFAAEDEGRTEEPTEKKKREAREEGNIPFSMEFPSAIVMGAGFLVIWAYGTWMIYVLKKFSVKMMSMQYADKITPETTHTLLMTMAWEGGKIVFPVAVAGYVAALASSIAQTGFMFTLEPLKFDLQAIMPSWSKLTEEMLLSKQVAWELGKALLKIGMVGAVAFEVIYTGYTDILLLIELGLVEAVGSVLNMAFEIILKTVILLLILSPIDYAFEYYQHIQDLKMTPQEVEDEEKQREGNPEVQERQQERMQEMSERRMMEEVPEADVVITNPTHYAVALQFDERSMEAPQIVARGKDFKAQRIMSIADENGIPVYEIPLLARTLYQLEMGEEIPPELYETVATVLAWVHEGRGDISEQEAAKREQEVKELDFAPTG